MNPLKPSGHHDKFCPCPECVERRATRNCHWLIVAVLLAALAFGCLLQLGCTSPVVPREVRSEQASWDGGEQNSGIIAAQSDGFLVTPHFRERFNALADLYGRAFSPALARDEGLRPLPEGTWFITPAAMTKFIQMNRWKKSGRAPSTK